MLLSGQIDKQTFCQLIQGFGNICILIEEKFNQLTKLPNSHHTFSENIKCKSLSTI